MRRKQESNRGPAWAALLLAALIVGAVSQPAWGQQTSPPSTARNERPVLPKPAQTLVDSNQSRTDVIVVKFREGTHIRLQNDQWVAPRGARSFDEERLLRRANLDEAQVLRELDIANGLLQSNANLTVARLFSRPEAELDVEKEIGELGSNEELADLNLYYHIFLNNASVEDAEALLDALNALDIVEIAYPQPIVQLPQVQTPNLTGEQGYLNAAAVTTPGSNGVDARYAWTLAGGRGQGLRVIDTEYDHRDGHEDLPTLFYTGGTRMGDLDSRNHGTAVLGVVSGVENTFGVTGIAPLAQLGMFYHHGNVANGINQAAAQLSAGDLILIEAQAGGPPSGEVCTCNCGQFEYIPVEYYPESYDAIRAATISRRLVVVEAAGNGSMNLDHPRYDRRFDRSFRDSLAILVGAGTSNGRAPHCWTNSGARVDVQGWGDSVVTTGYGDRFGTAQGLAETRWYTSSFSGTSSASPIITGAAAAVQGVRRTRGISLLDSSQMRGLLYDTGVAQAAGRPIGPLPNLRDAIALYVDSATGVVFRYGTPAQPYKTLTEATNAAWDNARVRIKAGTYSDRGTFTRPMIWETTGGTVTIGP